MRTSEHPVHLTDPVLARRRRRVGLRAGLLLAILAAVLAGAVYGVRGILHNLGPPQCQASAGGRTVSVSPEQAQNAATITAVAVRRGLPPRAASIAITTAWQESKLRNLGYGDRDSLGLFQQRPSQGWGTATQIRDPVHASNAFYDAMLKVSGWRNADIGQVAQRVQRSGFPQAYAAHTTDSRTLASSLSGQTPASFGCRLSEPNTAARPRTVATALERELGVRPQMGAHGLRLSSSDSAMLWAAAAWSVAHAEQYGVSSVTVGARTWVRSREASAAGWHDAGHPGPAGTMTLRVGG